MTHHCKRDIMFTGTSNSVLTNYSPDFDKKHSYLCTQAQRRWTMCWLLQIEGVYNILQLHILYLASLVIYYLCRKKPSTSRLQHHINWWLFKCLRGAIRAKAPEVVPEMWPWIQKLRTTLGPALIVVFNYFLIYRTNLRFCLLKPTSLLPCSQCGCHGLTITPCPLNCNYHAQSHLCRAHYRAAGI